MEITDQEREFCAQVELLHGIGPEALTALLTDAERMHIEPMAAIISEGDMGSDMYILLEGSVRISKRITLWNEGAEDLAKDLTILTAQQYAHFGEMGLLEHDERTATVTALTPCTLIKISQDSFETFAASHPRDAYIIAHNMARVLSSRLRKSDKDIVKLTTVLGIALAKSHRS